MKQPTISPEDEELLIILCDYSNDLHNIKMRDGMMPADAAIERIKVYGEKRYQEGELREASRALGVAINHRMDSGEDIVKVLAARVSDLKSHLKGEKQ